MESPPTDRLRLIDAMFVDACVSRRARELAASTPPPPNYPHAVNEVAG